MRPSRRRRRICLVEMADLEVGFLEAEEPEAEAGIGFEVESLAELEVLEVVVPEVGSPEVELRESGVVEVEVESFEIEPESPVLEAKNLVAEDPETEDPGSKDNMAAPDAEGSTELHEAEGAPEMVVLES